MSQLLAGVRLARRAALCAAGLSTVTTLSHGLALAACYSTPAAASGPVEGVAAAAGADVRRLKERAGERVRDEGRRLRQLAAEARERLRAGLAAVIGPAPAAGSSRALSVWSVGDSVVTGVGCAPESGNGPALPRSIGEEVARRLGGPVQWKAFGRTGADVSELRELVLPAVAARVRSGERADAVVVLCGVNDMKRCAWRSSGTFREELQSLIAELRAEVGAECYIVLPGLPMACTTRFSPPWLPSYLGPVVQCVSFWWEEQKRSLEDAARRVVFVPAPAHVDVEGAVASDGVHPNDVGYEMWGRHIGTHVAQVCVRAATAKA